VHRLRSFALLAALAAVAPQRAAAQASAPDPAAREHVRDSWYIGFGLGSGVANLTVDGATRSFRDVLRGRGTGTPFNVAFQFEVGATLREDLLVGLDLRALRSQGKAGPALGDVDLGLTASQALAMLTWFPAQRGFFLRAGGGYAGLTEDTRSGSTRVSEGHDGGALLAGGGYAFWLGRHFNLTLNLDVSAQFYGGGAGLPSSSRVADLYLGFTWY
jgi:hypothetical protein